LPACSVCGYRLKRVYIRKLKSFKGIGWLCYACTQRTGVLSIITSVSHSDQYIVRPNYSMCYIPSLGIYKRVIRRRLYLRSGKRWGKIGWLLFDRDTVFFSKDLIVQRKKRPLKSERERLPPVVPQKIIPSAFCLPFTDKGYLVFDVLKGRAYCCSSPLDVSNMPCFLFSVLVYCPVCGKINNYVVADLTENEVYLSCTSCNTAGLLNLEKKEMLWYTDKVLKVENVNMLYWKNKGFNFPLFLWEEPKLSGKLPHWFIEKVYLNKRPFGHFTCECGREYKVAFKEFRVMSKRTVDHTVFWESVPLNF